MESPRNTVAEDEMPIKHNVNLPCMGVLGGAEKRH